MFLLNTEASRFVDRTDWYSGHVHSIPNVAIANVYAIVNEQKEKYINNLSIHTSALLV